MFVNKSREKKGCNPEQSKSKNSNRMYESTETCNVNDGQCLHCLVPKLVGSVSLANVNNVQMDDRTMLNRSHEVNDRW